jgi:hypothetical protein
MKFSTLQRLGGVSIIVGSLLLAAYSLCWATLLPVHERMRDPSVIILNSNWIWISCLPFVGVILMIFGFTAAYSKIYQKAGVLGFGGYFLVVLAYIFQAAKITWEIFIYPIIAGYGPSKPLIQERILMHHQLYGLFRICAEATIFIGVVLFCIVLIKSRFPKAAGILILCGAIIYGFGPIVHLYIELAGIFILASGCFVLGNNMFKTANEGEK